MVHKGGFGDGGGGDGEIGILPETLIDIRNLSAEVDVLIDGFRRVTFSEGLARVVTEVGYSADAIVVRITAANLGRAELGFGEIDDGRKVIVHIGAEILNKSVDEGNGASNGAFFSGVIFAGGDVFFGFVKGVVEE